MNILIYIVIVINGLFLQVSNGFLEGWWISPVSLEKNENSTAILNVNDQEIYVVRTDNFSLFYTLSGIFNGCTTLTVNSTEDGIVILPKPKQYCMPQTQSNASKALEVRYGTIKEGIVTLTVTSDSEFIDSSEAFTNVNVKIADWIDTFSVVIGWMYTIAWDISFLPQIVHNWQRQSVIGLSFDFLTFNLIGFTCYSMFNIGLYWIPSIQDEYVEKNPQTILHVRLNDVIFPVYAVLCTIIQIWQCFKYERGNQRVSTTCRIISTVLLLSAFVYMILVGAVDDIWWLGFLYWLSYIKLAITCIKYTPQIYQNYKLNSTEGWSIGQVSLDFTGGTLSLIQMFMLGYNYDDMHSVLSDPTKLGLGLLAIFFNIIFFIQHFILYRHNTIEKKSIDGDDSGKEIEKKQEKQKENSITMTVF